MPNIRIGILGFGTVGEGTYRMLEDNRESIVKRVGGKYEIAKIGIRDASKIRSANQELFTTDLESIVDDPSISVILELMGGESPAGDLISRALKNKKHVVTANKELIAKRGPELIREAADNRLDLHFEAAVGGGIPLIQPLKHQLSGNEVIKLMGILNGTTNYILTRMEEDGLELGAALQEAQSLGYAEADPTSDVDGIDAQYKIAILGTIAFGGQVSPSAVYREGIAKIAARDFVVASHLGYRIKLLGILEAIEFDGRKKVIARVHPTLLPKDHPLSDVRGVYNAVWVHGDFVGDVMFSGRGAGASATGSAVVGDLIDVCRNIRLGGAGHVPRVDEIVETLPIDFILSRYYLRIEVKDRPRCLGEIATVFGEHDVSLAAMEMRTLDPGSGEIVFLTHLCREDSFSAALDAVRKLEMVESIVNAIRVEAQD